jgi:hypothetical protein
MRILVIFLVTLGLIACSEQQPESVSDTAPLSSSPTMVEQIEQAEAAGKEYVFASPLDQIAADYVRLALLFGHLDANYVDAYHGPAAWRAAADAEAAEFGGAKDELLFAVGMDIDRLIQALDDLELIDETENFRAIQLLKTVRALAVRFNVVAGKPVSFDEEVAGIYDVEPPAYDLSEYDAVLAEIDALLPGEGSIAERVDAFRNTLAIPEDKLQQAFERAIAECRARTAAHFDLPEGERFRMEFVKDKPWSGYNYYQGDFESLIQINTDFPIIIDRAVDLGCHEGYPGHHVWNLFIERELVNERGWIEYTVNPLFGPLGPIAEGSGNYGIHLAFPGEEKTRFEREVLFPLAGLDPAQADKLDALNALTAKLSHATNEISRRYLDGELPAEEAVEAIQKYYLTSQAKAAQRLRFVDTYRAYVINYNIGQDIVRAYAEAGDDPWARFERVLTAPLTASDIKAEMKER